MGLFGKKKEEKQNKKELESFSKTLGFNDNPTSAKEKQRKFADDLEHKNQLVQALKNTFNRLLNENKISETDFDSFEDIIDGLKLQREVSNPHATKLIDLSIAKTLKFIEKMSDEYGAISARRYIARLKTLITEREDPTPKYQNVKYLEMEHNLFQIMVTFDALSNSIDNLKSIGARYKEEYLKYKEKGDKVRADRVLVEMKRLANDLDARQREYDALLKKEKLAQEIAACCAEQAQSVFTFEDEDFDMLNDICSNNVVDDKRINQGLEIVSRYKDKLKSQNTKMSISENDFENSRNSVSISQAEVDDLISKF